MVKTELLRFILVRFVGSFSMTLTLSKMLTKEKKLITGFNCQFFGIKILLWVEYIVNFIEFSFYLWMLRNFSTINN